MDRTPDATPTVHLGGTGKPERTAAPPETTERSAFDPTHADRFESKGELGRGGMGRIDDAYDHALDRPVAIKHMLSTSAVDLARFEREAKITARLEHPGIVPIHDAGRTADGTPFYVMRRVDGQPLDQRITRVLASRLALVPNVLAACDAVAFAHSRHVIHRDIKPTNILVGPFGETLVIDWGLARTIDEAPDGATEIPSSDQQLTRVGTVAGTPGFMAPEQARGEPVDARADVFALGATLFFVLAGALPYGSASATEMIGLAGAGRSADWTKVPTAVPPELVAIAKKAMASEADDRYRDAGELAADLRQFITGNLVGAYDYGLGARLWRVIRRHRAAFAVAAIGLAIVIAGGVVSVRRVIVERDAATHERAIAEQRRQEAQSNADLLRVRHALELTETDPVAAIAVLRGLSPDSARWPEAHVAAQAAFLNGIPFGFWGAPRLGYVEISTDNRQLLAASWNGGAVIVIDLIARTRISLQTEPGVTGIHWLGTNHIAIARLDRLDIIDLHTRRTRTLPIATTMAFGSHGDRVWLITRDQRLLEIAGPDGEPRELATDVIDVAAAPDLSEAVIVHPKVAEVWTPTRRLPLLDMPKEARPPTFSIGGRRIAMITDSKLHMWHLDGARIIDDGTLPGTRTFVLVMIANDQYVMLSTDGTGVVVDGKYKAIDMMMGSAVATLRGVAQLGQNGAMRIFDEEGIYSLGRRAAGLRKADESGDGRFLAAVTETGDILAWDLRAIRPVVLGEISSDQLSRMTDHYLWLSNVANGISRINLATHQREQVYDRPVGEVIIDERERWIAFRTFDKLGLIDLTTHLHLAADALAFAAHDDTLIELTKDGALETWTTGDDHFRTRAHLPVNDFVQLGAGGPVAIAAYGDHVVRIDLATGTQERHELRGITGLGMQTNGDAWLLSPDGVIRWPLRGKPLPFALPVPPVDAAIDGNLAVFYTGDSITTVHDSKRTTIAHASKEFTWGGGGTLATLDTEGRPSLIDLDTGLAFSVSGMVSQAMCRGAHFAAVDYEDIKLWTFAVPDEPGALRAWLTTITNATSVADSPADAYAWP